MIQSINGGSYVHILLLFYIVIPFKLLFTEARLLAYLFSGWSFLDVLKQFCNNTIVISFILFPYVFQINPSHSIYIQK